MKPTHILSALATALALAAGAMPPSPTPKGIALADLDPAADPCTDFYAFANGAWRAANPIPAGTQRWSRRAAAREVNRQQVRTLLEELAAKREHRSGTFEQQLGDHFAACMDEAAIDAAGVTPLAPLRADIASVRDVAGIGRVVRRLHELGVAAPFVVTAASDYHDPAAVIVNITAGGLGLPGPDYYLEHEPRFEETRATYRAHVAAVLALGGMADAEARRAAYDILALETRLAEASLGPAAAADPAATAHKVSFEELTRLAPRLDWARYFTEAGLPRTDLNVAEPAFLQRLNQEIETTPVAVWKDYLRWHLLESASPWLAKPFADESLAFKDKYLAGATTIKPRAIRCLESTEALLGESLGRAYAERHFPPAAKAKVQQMVGTLLTVLKEDVAGLAWMAPETRQHALAKLAAYDVKVGYPDAWTDASTLVIRRDRLWENVAAARRFRVDVERRRVGHRLGREIWQLPPSSPDAYIDVQLNQIVLPAGFLQAPAFDLAATDAANYGAIGIGVAHDLTHAIDAGGAEFDAAGQPRNWWSSTDREAFARAGQCVADQYEGYVIEPGVHHQGKRVLSEAIGDLAGVRLAYRAFARSTPGHPIPAIGGFTAEQQFFISWGQYRGAAESLELQRQLVNGPHPTSKYRVIGPLANSVEFQQAFACKAGSAMARPPDQRCAVW